MVNSLKGVSSRLFRIESPDRKKRYSNKVLWSPSYFAASCGGHRWALLSNTPGNRRPRSNEPYIPALKLRGFTARAVRQTRDNPAHSPPWLAQLKPKTGCGV